MYNTHTHAYHLGMAFLLGQFCFFFSSRRRHTNSKRDWSSDVCSSDLSPRRGVTLRCLLAELHKLQHRLRQCIADAGDGAGCAAVYKTVIDSGIHADHEGHVIVLRSDVLRCIAQVCRTTKFLEPDQVRIPITQFEEHIGTWGKTIHGAGDEE